MSPSGNGVSLGVLSWIFAISPILFRCRLRTKYGNINIEEPVYPDLSNSPGVFGTLYSIGLYTQNNKGEEEPESSFERGEGIARYGRIFKNNYGLK